MSKVLCYVEDIERLNFFNRFQNLDRIYITTNIIVWIMAKFKGTRCFYVHKKLRRYMSYNNTKEIEQTIERKCNHIDPFEALNLADAILSLLDKLHKEHKFEYFFLWNGNKIGDKVCNQFANTYNIKKCFFEISNIPGKLFVDKLGTNKQSSIFIYPEILQCNFENIADEYEVWREKYLNVKRGSFVLPQSKKRMKYLRVLSSLINVVAIFFGIAFNNKIYKRNLVDTSSKRRNLIDRYIEEFTYNCKAYIFVPLQVSNDTQLMINSNIGLHGLIDEAVKLAKRDGVSLVVKPHPAEVNEDILDYTSSKKDECEVIITTHNTMELIEHSQYVVTINSTVGLEALIIGKKVITLGDAIYSRFNDESLKKYIMNYLINIEYFSNERICEEDISKVLEKGGSNGFS